MTADTWDRRASRTGLHAVLTKRWSPAQCTQVDKEQQRAVAAILPPMDGKRVLDIGCGIGRITGWLAAGMAHGKTQGPAVPALVVGIDGSSAMLARAGERVSGGNVHFVRACAQRLPFADNAFDVAVTVSVLQHVIDDAEFRAACQEIGRTVRLGGCLVCLEGMAGASPESGVGRDNYPDEGTPIPGIGTIRRDIGQFGEAFRPWLILDDARPLRCITDDYVVSRWTRASEAN